MHRTEKVAVVDEFKTVLGEAQSVILAEFRGLTVAEATLLRASCRENGVTFRVIKNTLAKRAIAGTDLEVVSDKLSGPTAWAFSTEDAIQPARVLVDILKGLGDGHLTIKGGFLDGKSLDAAEVVALSKLPGKDELRSALLSVLLAPGTKLVRVLAARPVELLQVLKARQAELEKD